jgi:hypothetical protein
LGGPTLFAGLTSFAFAFGLETALGTARRTLTEESFDGRFC